MKLLTKFGSCWQSPPHHSSTVSGFEQENPTISLNPKPNRRSSSAHWRPALTAISEDSSVAVLGAGDEQRRKTVKRRPARAPKHNYSRDVDSSWKVQAQIAIPAFSPAPFMF